MSYLKTGDELSSGINHLWSVSHFNSSEQDAGYWKKYFHSIIKLSSLSIFYFCYCLLLNEESMWNLVCVFAIQIFSSFDLLTWVEIAVLTKHTVVN